MKAVKQFLLILPILFGSLLSFINPASAFTVDSAAMTPKTELITPQPSYAIASTAISHSQTSNPIIDHLGCSCASCTQTKLEIQGKLPLANFL
jgi:hypothetical protein